MARLPTSLGRLFPFDHNTADRAAGGPSSKNCADARPRQAAIRKPPENQWWPRRRSRVPCRSTQNSSDPASASRGPFTVLAAAGVLGPTFTSGESRRTQRTVVSSPVRRGSWLLTRSDGQSRTTRRPVNEPVSYRMELGGPRTRYGMPCPYPHFCPVGTGGNSPAVYCWDATFHRSSLKSPVGTIETFNRPYGTIAAIDSPSSPAMNRWAIVKRPSGSKSSQFHGIRSRKMWVRTTHGMPGRLPLARKRP
jgi:hypothetical protein